MRDFLCKVYDKLYYFLGYADMRLILGYELGGKGSARISFYIRGLRPLFLLFFTLPGISFTTLVLQNITSSTRAKVAACGRNPRMFAGSQPGPL